MNTKSQPAAPSAAAPAARPALLPPAIARIAPGLALCLAVTVVAHGLEWGEAHLFRHPWLESLVLAILIGAAIRTLWNPGPRYQPGIQFSAKLLLEIAVVLLGASVSAANLLSIGPALLVGIAAVVALGLSASYGLCRLLGLPPRMATLVACGNSICGNSAIAAVAPIIGADSRDVAASIAFTAVLGVLVVLGLPLIGIALGMSGLQFGALAGLTVYAVPQVLAATAPLGATAIQVGTIVKLTRVLMLGPVCLVLSLITSRLREEPDVAAPDVTAGDRPKGNARALHKLVPWFIIGFVVLIAARSLGLIPQPVQAPIATLTSILTVMSMAALGLGVDMRVVASVGPRVIAAVTASLVVLGAISLLLIRLLGLA